MIDWMLCPVCAQPFDATLGQAFPGGPLLCPLCFKSQKTRQSEDTPKRR